MVRRLSLVNTALAAFGVDRHVIFRPHRVIGYVIDASLAGLFILY